MSTFKKGILGAFSGKTGTVIGASWKGRPVMRSLPVKSSKPKTQAQLDQQEKFSLAVNLLAGMADLLKVSFDAYSAYVSGYNAAVSYNIQRAIVGLASPFSIDYSMVKISLGALPNASMPVATAVAGNQVKFDWADNTGIGKAKDTDTAILVAFCPENNRSVYVINGASRSGLTQTMDTSIFAGKTVETWLAFQSADGKVVSDSVYTGSVILVP